MKASETASFIALKKLISERQQFEFSHQEEPYISHPTNVDFEDISHKTLLEYAVELGDLEEVKNLIEQQGATINEKILSAALNQDNIVLADWLFNHTEKCNELLAFNLKTKKGRDCLQNKITDDLTKFVDEENAFNVSPQSKFIPLEDDADETVKNNEDSESDQADVEDEEDLNQLSYTQKYLLIRYAESNRWEYVNSILTQNKEIDSKVVMLLFYNAVSHHRVDELKKLIEFLNNNEFYASKKNKHTYFLTKALSYAVENKDFTLSEFLLEQGADINYPIGDYNGNTLLAEAISKESYDLESIQYILSKNPDITQLNLLGQSVLHQCERAKRAEVTAFITSLPFSEEFKKLEDIFGYTADDYKKLSSDEVSLEQVKLTQIIQYYLRLDYADSDSGFEDGVCNGLSRIIHLYGPEYFYSTLKLINSWNGDPSQLTVPFPKDIPQAAYYNNLDELLKHWSNYLAVYQDLDEETLGVKQDDREEQQAILTDSHEQYPITLYKKELDMTQLEEILHYFYKMPDSARIQFNDEHATTTLIPSEKTMHYYDCNFEHPTKPITDEQKFVDFVMNTKCRLYAECFDLSDVKENVNMYIHQQDKNEFEKKGFRLLTKDDLPQSEEEAIDFQNRSANGFTPYHIAIIGRDITLLHELIKDGHCNVNAVDNEGIGPLTLAIQMNYPEAVQALLLHPKLQPEIHLDLFQSNAGFKHDLFKLIVQSPITNRLTWISKEALDNGDMELVRLLISNNKFYLGRETLAVAILSALKETPPNEEKLDLLFTYQSSSNNNNKGPNIYVGSEIPLKSKFKNKELAPLFQNILKLSSHPKESLEFLIDHGFKVNQPLVFSNKSHFFKPMYPILFLLKNPSPSAYKLIEILRQKGVDLNVKDEKGQTASELLDKLNTSNQGSKEKLVCGVR